MGCTWQALLGLANWATVGLTQASPPTPPPSLPAGPPSGASFVVFVTLTQVAGLETGPKGEGENRDSDKAGEFNQLNNEARRAPRWLWSSWRGDERHLPRRCSLCPGQGGCSRTETPASGELLTPTGHWRNMGKFSHDSSCAFIFRGVATKTSRKRKAQFVCAGPRQQGSAAAPASGRQRTGTALSAP